MTDENQVDEPELKMTLEPADGAETLGEAQRLRLAVEGEPDTIRLLSEIVMQLVGGEVTRAVAVDLDGEQRDVTPDFARTSRIDVLDIIDIGDDSDEA